MQKEKNFLSVVVYVKNHSPYIEKFITSVYSSLLEHFGKIEIIFVDDASTDDSVELIKSSIKELNSVSFTLITMGNSQGLEKAILAGDDSAIGDFIIEFDSPIVDFDSDFIYEIYKTCLSGYDIVGASANSQINLSSKIFYKIFQLFSKNNTQLYSESFRILSRRAINRVNILNKSVPYRKAIYSNCGLKTTNVWYNPVNKNRKHQDHQDLGNRIELAINAIIIFTNLASRFTVFLSVVMSLFSLGMILYTAITYLTYNEIVEGWTTTMLLMSISFTALFVLFTILIKYVSLLLSLQYSKQTYIIENLEKLN